MNQYPFRGKIAGAEMVCISASEGSWNLIIVNHVPGSLNEHRSAWVFLCDRKKERGSTDSHMYTHVQRTILVPTDYDFRENYRGCHSFPITNTGVSELATSDWCMSAWQPAIFQQASQPRIMVHCRGCPKADSDLHHKLLNNNSKSDNQQLLLESEGNVVLFFFFKITFP